MTDQEIEYLIYNIFYEKTLFIFEDKEYCLRKPSINEKRKSLQIYNSVINSQKYTEWLREAGLIGFLIHTGCWNTETPMIIKSVEQQIEKQKISLYINRANFSLVKKIKENIDALRKRLDKILSYKYSAYQNTLEAHAESVQNEYLAYKCLMYKNRQVFANRSELSSGYAKKIISECYSNVLSVSAIREIARSSLWRSIWQCGHDRLFDKSAILLTDEQRTLINYSIMYDNIASHPDSPEDYVIKDDDMTDGWILYQKDKAKKDQAESTLASRHPNSSEIFMMVKDQNELDIVNSMNDINSNMIAKSRIKQVQNKKEVRDVDFEDVSQDINANLKTRKL